MVLGNKGQWARMMARENRSIARRNRVLFTSYLMENGYTDPDFIARFWSVSLVTAKKYVKEASHVRLDDSGREKIKEIQERENCDMSTAIAKRYDELMNPKGCFIATAAYGTAMSAEIDYLRRWRDEELQGSTIGREFINIYYSISPPIAKQVKRHHILQRLVRTLLKPVIIFLKVKYRP